MAAINFPTAASTPSRTTYTLEAPWTDSVNGGEWWFNSTKVRWMPVVAGGASDFADLGGVPADNTALAAALALKAPLAGPAFTDSITLTSEDGEISVIGDNNVIYASGVGAKIYTLGVGSIIQTGGTFKLDNGTHATTLSHAPTANQAIAFPNASGTLALTSDIPTLTAASVVTLLGLPTKANLTTANTDLAIGSLFYNTALSKLDITTA